jgi:hypothetical protein
LICRLPFLWQIFPNIDGEYEIEVSSNWSLINSGTGDAQEQVLSQGDVDLFGKIGRAKIIVRLNRIDMNVVMNDEYLSSETVSCSLHRELGERAPSLFYVYEAFIAKPKPSDSDHHLGAGRIKIPLERFPRVLQGVYWTNRNWHRGLNTAGQVRLTRTSA